jgi:O-Antigen ligase
VSAIAARLTGDPAGFHARGAWIVAAALAAAGAYCVAIVETNGAPVLLAPLLAALLLIVLCAHPVAGVFLSFGCALLLEQYTIIGLTPITADTHFYQNLSAYTDLPIRLSAADLLMLLTLASWAIRAAAGREPKPRMGPFGWPIVGYALIFVVGTAIGLARGGPWDLDATLAEVREPLQMCVFYFLAANLLRTRQHTTVLLWGFVVLVGVKGVQAILNYQAAGGLPYNLEAVTGHEDVVFFDAAVGLGVAMAALGSRSKLAYTLFALLPMILVAEMLTERRVGFIALGVVVVLVTILSFAVAPRRALILVAVGALAASAYVGVFWDSTGPFAEPIRAVRSVLDPSYVSVRDEMSDSWRVTEDGNIAYTMRALPLTGVGVGQRYLTQQFPPPLPPGFTYWRYITHNALLWIWLIAGPLGALAFWFLVARVVLISSAQYVGLRDAGLRAAAVFPACLITCQVVFSGVELGLTYARTMIVLGTVLGMSAVLMDRGRGIPSAQLLQVPAVGKIQRTGDVGDRLQDPRRIPDDDQPAGHVARDHAPRTDERALADGDERKDRGVRPDLSAALDDRPPPAEV